MRLVSKVGICKDPTSFFLDVAGEGNFEGFLNLQANLFLDGTATIEAASGAGGDVTIGASADTTDINIGSGAHAKNIVIGNDNDTVTIRGTTTINESIDLVVEDKLITLNKGGAAGSADEAGIEFEENSVITGSIKIYTDRAGFTFKAPANAGSFRIFTSASSAALSLVSTSTADRTWTFPDTSDTVVGLASTQTLTNKTVTSGNLNGTTSVSGTLNVSAGSTFSSTATFSSSATFNGNVTFGDATSDTVSFTSRLNSDFVPSTDNTRNLGSSSLRWANAYATNVDLTGNLTVAGNTTLGDASTDTIFFSGRLDSSIIPKTNGTFDLGSTSLRMRKIWTTDLDVSSSFTVNNLTVNGNTVLGNATSDTVSFTARVNTTLAPSGNFAQNLGGSGNAWANIYSGTLHARDHLFVSTGNGTGFGISLADDGYLTDENDGFLGLRFNQGVRIWNTSGIQQVGAAGQGMVVNIELRSDGIIAGNGRFTSQQFVESPHMHVWAATPQVHGQGGIWRWNLTGNGMTNFMNNRGLGAGGFSFWNSNGSVGNPTVQADYTELMYILGTGGALNIVSGGGVNTFGGPVNCGAINATGVINTSSLIYCDGINTDNGGFVRMYEESGVLGLGDVEAVYPNNTVGKFIYGVCGWAEFDIAGTLWMPIGHGGGDTSAVIFTPGVPDAATVRSNFSGLSLRVYRVIIFA